MPTAGWGQVWQKLALCEVLNAAEGLAERERAFQVRWVWSTGKLGSGRDESPAKVSCPTEVTSCA